MLCGPEKGRFTFSCSSPKYLPAEAVQGSSLTLQRVDDVHCRDGFALGVFRVGDGIADNVFQENFEYSASLLIYEAGNSLDSSSTSQTTYRRLRDTLNIISKNFSVTLGAS